MTTSRKTKTTTTNMCEKSKRAWFFHPFSDNFLFVLIYAKWTVFSSEVNSSFYVVAAVVSAMRGKFVLLSDVGLSP